MPGGPDHFYPAFAAPGKATSLVEDLARIGPEDLDDDQEPLSPTQLLDGQTVDSRRQMAELLRGYADAM